jgi:hypothetical protein
VAALAVVLQSHPTGTVEERSEARCEIRVVFDLAGDVANATQPDAQELQRPPGALELMGAAVAADHDGRALDDPH